MKNNNVETEAAGCTKFPEAEAIFNFLSKQEVEAVLKVLLLLPFLPNKILTFLIVVNVTGDLSVSTFTDVILPKMYVITYYPLKCEKMW